MHNWIWRPEKFRYVGWENRRVSKNNPVPMLVKSESVEDIRKNVSKFNEKYPSGYLYPTCEIIGVRKVTREDIDFHNLHPRVHNSKLIMIDLNGQIGHLIQIHGGK
mgnify:CR=1 FL=1